jgi:hypothetical protein
VLAGLVTQSISNFFRLGLILAMSLIPLVSDVRPGGGQFVEVAGPAQAANVCMRRATYPI